MLSLLRIIIKGMKIGRHSGNEGKSRFKGETENLSPSISAGGGKGWPAQLGPGARVEEKNGQPWWTAALENGVRDVRYAIRGMRRSPSFTIVSILTLGLGIGAISTVLTLANTLFFRNLPAQHADELLFIHATRQHGRLPGWVTQPEYLNFREQSKTLSGLAAHCSNAPLFVMLNRQVQQINGAVVSANFFSLLEIKPVLGRFFHEDEDSVPNRDRVAVLSYQFWQTWFNGSPDALGKTIKINNDTFTVIGVAPPSFRGVMIQPSEIYIPTMMISVGLPWCQNTSDCAVLDMIGRLKAGRKIEEARAEMATFATNLWMHTAAETICSKCGNLMRNHNSGMAVVPAQGVSDPNMPRDTELHFVKLLGMIAGLLLLVCCANLSGLVLLQNNARNREFAIRSSLGATGGRLIRLLVTELLLLAVSGSFLGILISMALTGVLKSKFYSIDVEGRTLFFNFAITPGIIVAGLSVSVVAALLSGFIALMKSAHTHAVETLRDRSASRSGYRSLGHVLVGAQAAMAVGLIVVATLLVSSAYSSITGNNFEASHVALLRLRPGLVQYSPGKAQQFISAAMHRLEAMPGVESVSVVGAGAVLMGSTTPLSLPSWPQSDQLETGYLEIGARYFETLRIPVLAGREFNDHDGAGTLPIAIISESMARLLWPEGNAIGSGVMIKNRLYQVVGIVADVQLQKRDSSITPYVYIPYWQIPTQIDARLCIRVKKDPAGMLPNLVQETKSVDPNVPLSEILPLSVQIAGTLQSLRITASMISYTAILAVFLSALGLYAELAMSVSRRSKEISVRMALGAASAEIRRMVLRDGMMVVFIGIIAGFGLAATGSRFVYHLLYRTGISDVVWYMVAGLLLSAVGLLACWIPAQRAARVDPIAALKQD
jgi:predicted permease